MVTKIILALMLTGCTPLPEPPPGVSLAFECTLHGILILEGYLTVHESVAEQASKFDLASYWLECDSPDARGLKCRTLE